MKFRRWTGWAVYQLPDQEDPEEVCIGRYFTRWGTEFALDMKLGATSVIMIWAHGDIEWIRGEARPS